MRAASGRWVAFLVASACSASCGAREGGLTLPEWSTLAEGEWSLAEGAENANWYRRIVLTEDVNIAALRTVASPGTHHITLSTASADDVGCATAKLGTGTMYAVEPGASELRLPSGVVMRLYRGQPLCLQLHVYNPTTQPIDGFSRVDVVRVKPEAIRAEAGFVFAGPERITLPPKQRTTIAHTCRVTSDQTAVVLLPLMHKLGVGFKATVWRGSEPKVLYDGAFRADDQTQVSLGTLALKAGDALALECTFDNPTYGYVTKGHDGGEICYGALLRYPSDATVDCAEARAVPRIDGSEPRR